MAQLQHPLLTGLDKKKKTVIYFIGKKKAVAVAQLVERLLRIQKVRGSNPISTI